MSNWNQLENFGNPFWRTSLLLWKCLRNVALRSQSQRLLAKHDLSNWEVAVADFQLHHPAKSFPQKHTSFFLYYIPQISFFIPQNKGCSLCKEFPGVVWTGKPTCTFHKWKCERENQHTIFGNLEANLPRKQIERFLVQNIQKMNDVNGKTNTWFFNYSLQTNINFWIS